MEMLPGRAERSCPSRWAAPSDWGSWFWSAWTSARLDLLLCAAQIWSEPASSCTTGLSWPPRTLSWKRICDQSNEMVWFVSRLINSFKILLWENEWDKSHKLTKPKVSVSFLSQIKGRLTFGERLRSPTCIDRPPDLLTELIYWRRETEDQFCTIQPSQMWSQDWLEVLTCTPDISMCPAHSSALNTIPGQSTVREH